MANPLISIIIPVYNAEKFLKRCIDSTLKQTYKNIEIICVNDGSKDKSLEILKGYAKEDDRIVIVDKENAGVSVARNDAIRVAKGEYVAFLDSDDWLENDAIETLYNCMIEEKVDIVRANYYRNYQYNENLINENLGELKNRKINTKDELFPSLVIDKVLDGKMITSSCLLLVKKEKVMQTSLFKTDIVLSEDTIFYLELFELVDSIYFLDKPIYHYYCNNKSCTNYNKNFERNAFNLVKVSNYISNIIENSKYNIVDGKERINAYIANNISNYFFVMYKDKLKNRKELKSFIITFFEKDNAIEIFKTANTKLLPMHLRLPIMLIRNRKYELLLLYYSIRNILRNIRRG
mgnify:CR=1 FL=1